MIGMRSWPSTSRPHSSLVVKSIGPTIRSRPRSRSQAAAASSRAPAASGSSSHSKKPNRPQSLSWNSLKLRSTWAVMRPTGWPSRQARKYSASACSKKGLRLRSRRLRRSIRSGGTQCGSLRYSRHGSLMNAFSSRLDATGRTSTGMAAAPYMPTTVDVFAKAREHERGEILRAAREADVVPYWRALDSAAGPVVEMESAERVMLGSNNYLGRTGDERVIRAAHDAPDRYGTGMTGSRFLNGTTLLHLELEQELAEWMGTEAALVFTTGHQANLGCLGTILEPGDPVVAYSGDHASILDGCILSRAKLRPFRHNRMDKLERTLERAAEDGGGVLVVVDGVFSMEGDVAPLA